MVNSCLYQVRCLRGAKLQHKVRSAGPEDDSSLLKKKLVSKRKKG